LAGGLSVQADGFRELQAVHVSLLACRVQADNGKRLLLMRRVEPVVIKKCVLQKPPAGLLSPAGLHTGRQQARACGCEKIVFI
jgi:hypothetical protein